jgi:hypothetical protein
VILKIVGREALWEMTKLIARVNLTYGQSDGSTMMSTMNRNLSDMIRDVVQFDRWHSTLALTKPVA